MVYFSKTFVIHFVIQKMVMILCLSIGTEIPLSLKFWNYSCRHIHVKYSLYNVQIAMQ